MGCSGSGLTMGIGLKSESNLARLASSPPQISGQQGKIPALNGPGFQADFSAIRALKLRARCDGRAPDQDYYPTTLCRPPVGSDREPYLITMVVSDQSQVSCVPYFGARRSWSFTS